MGLRRSSCLPLPSPVASVRRVCHHLCLLLLHPLHSLLSRSFCSPLSFRCARRTSVPADVYSFAVLLFEILTRRVPFSELNDPERLVPSLVRDGKRPSLPLDVVRARP